jgi:molybdopterin converting factor small subunit
MVRVVIPSGLANQFTGGVSDVDVTGATIRELIKDLENRYPGIGRVLTDEMAVAIDGEIFQTPMLEPVSEDSEIFFLLQIGGG